MSGETSSGEETGASSGLIWRASSIAFLAWAFSAYDYLLFGNILPVIADSFNWAPATVTTVVTWVNVGIFFVAMSIGPIADYFGRVKAMVITLVGAGLSSLLTGVTAVVPASIAVIYLIIVRAFSGFGYAEEVVNTTYLSEILPGEDRGFLYSFVQGGWPIGAILSAVFILWLGPIFHWSVLFVLATIPLLVVAVLAWWLLPETETYIEMENVKNLLSSGEEEKARERAEKQGLETEMFGDFSMRELFNPDLRLHTTSLSLAWGLNWMGIQVMTVLISVVFTEGLGISFTGALSWIVISNIGAYIGYVTHGWIGDQIGRRTTIITAWFISGITLSLMLVVTNPLLIRILYFIGLFFLLGPYSALLTYMGESYPTQARGTGSSFTHAFGAIGAIAGAAAITFVQQIGFEINIAAIFAGSLPIFLSAIVMFGAKDIDPGQELEDIAH